MSLQERFNKISQAMEKEFKESKEISIKGVQENIEFTADVATEALESVGMAASAAAGLLWGTVLGITNQTENDKSQSPEDRS